MISGAAKTKTSVPRLTKRIQIRNRQGLHARPAALFVQVASRFKCTVRLRKGRRVVDGKSIMGILTLAAVRGSSLEITAEGPDAREALWVLEQIISHHETPAVVHVVRRSEHH